jgi:fructan beta-fructosidase
MSVSKINNVWTLLQEPVAALKNYRLKATQFDNIQFKGEKKLPIQSQQMEIELTMDPGRDDSCGIKLAVGNGKYFTIGYSEQEQQLYIDRTNSGDTGFHPEFKKWLTSAVKLDEDNNKIKLHILFDKSIIEVFGNDGKVVLTEQLFADEKNNGVVLFGANGKTVFDQIKVWMLKSSWR